MLNFLCAVLLLIFSLQSFSQTLAESLLSRDIMASAKTMKNDVKIYNYFYLQEAWPELQNEAGRKAYVSRYISYRAGSFWNSEFNDASAKNYAAGAGLYFAIDPLISQPYGNSFIEITIPAGTQFINVVAPVPVKKDTISALISEGILNNQAEVAELALNKGFYRDTLRLMVLPQYARFRKAVQNIFTRNNIQFVEYNFNTSLMGFCKKHSYSAFNFVGQANAFDQTNAVLEPRLTQVSLHSDVFNFMNITEQEASQKSAVVKFRNVLEAIASMLKQGKAIKKEFLLTQYTEAEMQSIKTSTFSCDPQ